jgi:hypothetical protein
MAKVYGRGEARHGTYFGDVSGEWWNINVLGAYSLVALSNKQTLAFRLPTPPNSYLPRTSGVPRPRTPELPHTVSGMTYV